MQKSPKRLFSARAGWFLTLFITIFLGSLPLWLVQASTISILDSYTPGIGNSSSIAVLDGKPIISYYDNAHGDLRLAVCSNPACSPGTTFTTAIATEDDVGTRSAVAVSNGNPIIVYS